MYLFVVSLHVLLCIMLILIILLQPGKGDVGAAFGGGASASLFGPRGPANLLSRATTIGAVLFMCTSITLALYSNRQIMADGNISDELQRLQNEKLENNEEIPEFKSQNNDEPPVFKSQNNEEDDN